MSTEKNNKIPVTVSFDNDFIGLVDEVSKKNFCDRDTFIRRGTFELLEKLVPEKANSLKLARNSRGKNDVSLSPAVFDDLKKAYSRKGGIHQGFADTIVRLGIEEHKRIRKTANN